MQQHTPEIGPAIKRERKARKLTLEQLGTLSGVSKSMLSQIERGEANPTFAVLWSLTQAMEIELADLIGNGTSVAGREEIEVTSVMHTPVIRSADGSCRLKILSSPRLAGQTEWYELEMDPGGALVSQPHSIGAFEHFTAFTDGFEISSGGSKMVIRSGETARYRADVPHAIRNGGTDNGKGLLVVLHR